MNHKYQQHAHRNHVHLVRVKKDQYRKLFYVMLKKNLHLIVIIWKCLMNKLGKIKREKHSDLDGKHIKKTTLIIVKISTQNSKQKIIHQLNIKSDKNLVMIERNFLCMVD